MLLKIIIGLAVAVAALLVIIALQSPDFRVERKAVISAAPPEVFAQVNDFHNWKAWSPWAKRDPAMKETYEGPAAGAGAVYGWAGNKDVGEGRMKITESRPCDLVRIRLDFLRPFKATSNTEITFKPENGQTTVTWSMAGKNNFMAKAIHLFVNMDKMVGGDFEKGLSAMKSVVETMPKK